MDMNSLTHNITAQVQPESLAQVPAGAPGTNKDTTKLQCVPSCTGRGHKGPPVPAVSSSNFLHTPCLLYDGATWEAKKDVL